MIHRQTQNQTKQHRILLGLSPVHLLYASPDLLTGRTTWILLCMASSNHRLLSFSKWSKKLPSLSNFFSLPYTTELVMQFFHGYKNPYYVFSSIPQNPVHRECPGTAHTEQTKRRQTDLVNTC